jgi:large subunit ribosomal protein L4
MKQPIYNLEGEKIKEIEISPIIFDMPFDSELVFRTATSLASNKRRPLAHTKTRGEVRGGGKKPWSQKGTGNARAGSIRSPIFKGGGVTFGPRNKVNFKKKINKKERRKTFLEVFSCKLRDGELKIIDSFKLEKPNTKKLSSLLKKIGGWEKSGLVVTSSKNENLGKSVKNLERIDFLQATNVSSLDLLNHKFFYLDKESFSYYENKYKGVKIKKNKK